MQVDIQGDGIDYCLSTREQIRNITGHLPGNYEVDSTDGPSVFPQARCWCRERRRAVLIPMTRADNIHPLRLCSESDRSALAKAGSFRLPDRVHSTNKLRSERGPFSCA